MARTDDDSWDLASSVGATATMVAAARAVASRRPNPLINDPFAEPLVRAVGVEFFTRLASGALDLADTDAAAAAGLAQMIDWMAVRTRYFDEFCMAAAGALGGRAGAGDTVGVTAAPSGASASRGTWLLLATSGAAPWPSRSSRISQPLWPSRVRTWTQGP